VEDSRYNAREARLQPYRQQGTVSLSELAARGNRPDPAAGVPGMSRDPYAITGGALPMRSLTQPASPVVNVADLDPRWKRLAQ
jgi:hypothetical protein